VKKPLAKVATINQTPNMQTKQTSITATAPTTAENPSITEVRQSFSRKPYIVGEYYGKDEEGFCEQCGCPLYQGDKAQEIWWEYDQTEPVAFVCELSDCASAEINDRVQSEMEHLNF
jgi:hypothetical protein